MWRTKERPKVETERGRCFRQRYAVIEGKSLKFYDSEAEAQPQDGGIYAVIATISPAYELHSLQECQR